MDDERIPLAPFTPAEAEAAGVTEWALRQHFRAGHIERIAHGLYQRTGAPPTDLDLIEAVKRAPRATLCLTSALAHHGLVDEIPHTIDLAVPRGHRRPASSRPITWHLFAEDTFDLGRDEIPIEGTPYEIGLYSPERSIVDAYRMRNLVGYEIATEALRGWLARRGSNPAKLLAIARQLPRAQAPLRTALEYLG